MKSISFLQTTDYIRSHIVSQHPQDIFKNYSFGKMNSQKCKLNSKLLQTNSTIGSTNYIGIMSQVHYIDNQFNWTFNKFHYMWSSSALHLSHLPFFVVASFYKKSHNIRKTILYFKRCKFHICDMNDMVMPKKLAQHVAAKEHHSVPLHMLYSTKIPTQNVATGRTM